MLMKEIWKDIKDYEGLYQVSNLGNIKSLRFNRNLKINKTRNARNSITLCKFNKVKSFLIYNLVWDAFGDKAKGELSIDHIDNDRYNDCIDNLQLLTIRENISKCQKIIKRNDLPTGVSHKRKKFRVSIYVNKEHINLGVYNCPTVASFAYQKYLYNLIGNN